LWLFYYAASLTLILSFVALGILWRKPLLEGRDRGRPLSERWQRLLLWTGWRILFGAFSFGLLVLVWLSALVGVPDAGANLAPTFVWVIFWIGLVPIVVIFGNLWALLSPWRAAADAVAWVWERLGRGGQGGGRDPGRRGRGAGARGWVRGRLGRACEPAAGYPERLGRWPGALLLLAFAALELAYPRSAEP